MAYRIRLSSRAARALRDLDRPLQDRVRDTINDLKTNPRPGGSRPLVGYPDLIRIKAGDYRVIYRIDHIQDTIDIVRIGHRREVYRRLP